MITETHRKQIIKFYSKEMIWGLINLHYCFNSSPLSWIIYISVGLR